jgi:alkaline phosphatase D
VLGSGTNMGYNYTPEEAMNWFGPNTPDFRKNFMRQGIAAAKAGLPYNFDNWGGYPVARSRVFAHAQKNDLNLVVVSGDSHNGWAFDLPEDGRPAGVEFGGHSVSSPGIESATAGTDPNRIARDILARNTQELRWVDTSNRGYMHLSLTPKAATNNWVFMDTVRTLSLKTKPGHSLRVRPGRKVLEQA